MPKTRQDNDSLCHEFDYRKLHFRYLVMHRSNRNFNIPPRANPGHLTISCARGVGNLTFTSVGWGKLNQKCQVSSDFLLRGPKSLTVINTCLDEMEEFKGRDRTFVSDWLTKKGLQKL